MAEPFFSVSFQDFLALNQKFHFTVDACADRFNARLPRFWTEEDDILKMPWDEERLWIHPPYEDARLIDKILGRMASHDADLAVMLLPGWAITPEWWKLMSGFDPQTWGVTLAQGLGPFAGPRGEQLVLQEPLFFVRSE